MATFTLPFMANKQCENIKGDSSVVQESSNEFLKANNYRCKVLGQITDSF